MIDKIKSILNYTKGYYVIGITLKAHTLNCHLIELSFKDDNLKLVNSCPLDFNDESFISKLNKDYPIILHIEGDSIINKAVENKTGYRKNLIFKANQDDFYFYEYHQNETIYISVTRKSNVDELLEKLSAKHKYVTHLSLGPFVMANLLPIAKNYSELSSSNHTVKIENKNILSFDNKEESNKQFNINGDVFNEKELALLASFFGCKFPNTSIEFDTSFLDKNRSELKFKKWFKIAGVFTLIFFLVALLVSHQLLDVYSNTLAEKKSLSIVSQQNIEKLNTLKEEKIVKEKILQSSGISNKSFITKYIADIGNTVPPSLSIKAIHVMPYYKKIKPMEKINFDINTISISGESEDDKMFNQWIKSIESLKWIKKIEIEDYSQETARENKFSITIKI
ncbi:hypothetical protein [Hyunsoonleella pacifica]|uniref:General secretion pathway protein n=1 Tax=Hyunsoonleella pacifica TaxID=1080224 RepID=A0A4Q9FHZ9_9FLAO|nr:hypothetical protein [Hyunsoonleella pacifica]TBN11961.1 hypothetical protein EYD46_17490 [Hyunsoonleella pacifica]GGD07626.1 hypothetical protein GCM10011368_06960 [Hyunsoonleella pacifica]